MKIPSKIVVSCAAMALVAGTSLQAQQSGSQGSSSQQPSSGQQNPALQQARSQEFFQASKLVGRNTQDAKGQKLGEIKEIVFNQQGEIFALVDVGNSRWAAVPWQAVNISSAKGTQNIMLNTTQQALKSAPAVTKDQWGALNNPNFTKGIYSYYQLQPPTAIGGASSPGGSSQQQGSSEQQQQQHEQQK